MKFHRTLPNGAESRRPRESQKPAQAAPTHATRQHGVLNQSARGRGRRSSTGGKGERSLPRAKNLRSPVCVCSVFGKKPTGKGSFWLSYRRVAASNFRLPAFFEGKRRAARNRATYPAWTFPSGVLRPAPTLQIKIRDFPGGRREICKHCAGLVGARPTPQRTPDRIALQFGGARCLVFLENCSPREA
jgi:hypothetical protein